MVRRWGCGVGNHPRMSWCAHFALPPLQKQARRVCEILQLRVTDRGNPDQYTKYRLWVKSRLNEPYQVCVCVCVWVCVGVCLWVGVYIYVCVLNIGMECHAQILF